MTELDIYQSQLDAVQHWKERAVHRQSIQQVELVKTVNYGYWLNHKVIVEMIVDLDDLGLWGYTETGWFKLSHLRD